ncbi:MAG: divalent-cation tolerance protein CutA [Candidatus Sericytochromatia bacterium]
MSEHCVVYISTGSEAEARSLATALVKERLAACVNRVGPVTSTYIWEDKLQEDTEYLLVAKTRRGLIETLAARVRELHSYSLPEVIALPIVDGLPAYLDWISQATVSSDPSSVSSIQEP